MKPIQPALASIWLALMFTVASSPAAVLFSDNFETGLEKWTGKYGGAHHGITVPDPLASGRGTVLTFTGQSTAGDLFSTNLFSSSNSILISFDYLGLATEESVAGDLGGFLGISPGLPGDNQTWLAGTQEPNFPEAFSLIDDGQWHRVSITVDGASAGAFHLMLEDWAMSGGVAGDAYFDNVEVVEVVSPRLNIRVAEVELCFNTVSNAWHQLQFRSALPASQWLPLRTNFFRGDGTAFCTRDSVPLGEPQRIYRVVVTNGLPAF